MIAVRIPLLAAIIPSLDTASFNVTNGRLARGEYLRLVKRGYAEGELARLRSPIGLDLGARTPEETAVSIAAEIIAGRWGGSGEPLGAGSDRIHR